MERHGGLVLADTLIEHGVTHVFGMPGGQANAFYDAMAIHDDKITHILIRDETTAGYAADSFARITGRIGVCDATVGPGAAKFPSGLMEAYNSSIPVLYLVSDHPQNSVLLQQYGRISQGGDQLGILEPFAKEVFNVPSIEMLSKVVAAAIHQATVGRPGPVVVQIAQNIFEAKTNLPINKGTGTFPKYRCVPPQSQLVEALNLLKSAKRPVLIAGGGTQISQAYDEFSELLNKYKIPVTTTLSGKGTVSEENPLCLGVLGELGSPCAKKVVSQADLIIAVGYKHSQNSSHRWTLPAENQKLIHIDVDPSEFGRIFNADLGLWGDAKATLKELLNMLKTESYETTKDWQEEVITQKSIWLKQRNEEGENQLSPIWPQSILKIMAELMGEDDIIVCDAGFSSGWAGAFFESKFPGRNIILPRGAAGLGFSVPGALGAALARPNARVVSISGDGAFSYNVGELATFKQLDIPVINVIFNNSVLAWSKWTQRLNFEHRNKSVELGTFDFGAIAESYGIKGVSIENVAEFAPAFKEELANPRPSVINVYTDEWQAPTMPYRESLEKLEKGQSTTLAY